MKIRIKHKDSIMIVIYMLVFNPIKFKMLSGFAMPLFYGIIFSYLLINCKSVWKMLLNMKMRGEYTILRKSFSFFVCSLIISIILPMVHMTNDFSYVKNIIISEIIYFLRVLFLLLLTQGVYNKCNNLADKFMHLYASSMCLYVFFSIIMLLIPKFKNFWSSIINDSEHNILLSSYSQYTTRYGAAGFSGYKATFYCTVGVCFLLYFIVRDNYHINKKTILYYLQIVLLIIGNMFYGRSGLICSMLCVIIVICYELLQARKFSFLFFSIGVGCILIIIIAVLKEYNESVSKWYQWAFEFLINHNTIGKLSTAASDDLFNQMYFKIPAKILIVGSGYYTDPISGGYYLSTDAGIMRSILFSGVIGSLTAYMIPLMCIWGLSKGDICSIKVKKTRLLSFLLLFVLLFFEIKGEIFYIMSSFTSAILIGKCNFTGMNKRVIIGE